MENLLTATFEAHHPARNHHRRYQITVGRDLLAAWTLTIAYGRVGQQGQEQRFAANSPGLLSPIIRDRLSRRLSADRRLGCPYRLSALSCVPGLDPAVWLPPDILARFVTPTGAADRDGSGADPRKRYNG